MSPYQPPPLSEAALGQRVGLARALFLQPEILVRDEPTTGRDPLATENEVSLS